MDKCIAYLQYGTLGLKNIKKLC